MKLSASVLATLCALGTTGCEPIYMAQPPVTPTQPTVEMHPDDPRIETIEGVEFAQPPPDYHPAVAPVRPRPVVRPQFVPQPQPQIQYRDPCPACGMG